MGGGSGAELEFVRAEQTIELVEDDPRLHHTGLLFGVDGDQTVAVLRPVDDDSGVGALSSQAGSTTTGEDGGTESGTHLDRDRSRVDITRNDHPKRHLAVIGAVRGVGSDAPPVETDFTVDLLTQFLLECHDVHGGYFVVRRTWSCDFPHARRHARRTMM